MYECLVCYAAGGSSKASLRPPGPRASPVMSYARAHTRYTEPLSPSMCTCSPHTTLLMAFRAASWLRARPCPLSAYLRTRRRQGFLLLFGGFTSAVLSRKLAQAPFKSFVPQLLGIAAFTAELWLLQVAPHHWLVE
jgi:hypothetical protein